MQNKKRLIDWKDLTRLDIPIKNSSFFHAHFPSKHKNQLWPTVGSQLQKRPQKNPLAFHNETLASICISEEEFMQRSQEFSQH